MKPIIPNELLEKKRALLPDFVIDAFNNLITEKWNGRFATFTQDAVIERILGFSRPTGTHLTRAEVFEHHYLDVEDIYREAGWIVEYDKPAYNETYPATFIFSEKRQ